MDIFFPQLINRPIEIFKEVTINRLNIQQKKIVAVVLIIFTGLLLVAYMFYRYYFKADATQRIEDDLQERIENPPHPVGTTVDRTATEVLDDITKIPEVPLINNSAIPFKNLSIADNSVLDEEISKLLGLPFKILPAEVILHILSLVDNPLLIKSVCKDWYGIIQMDIYPQILREIENAIEKKPTEADYQRTMQRRGIDTQQLSQDEIIRFKTHLLFQQQKQKLWYFLGKETARAFLKTKCFKARDFISTEHWLKDYTFLRMCLGITGHHNLSQSAFQSVKQVRNHVFDITPTVQLLKQHINSRTHPINISHILIPYNLYELPPEINLLTSLENLTISSDEIKELPPMNNLINLTYIYLHTNPIPENDPNLQELRRRGVQIQRRYDENDG